MGRFVVGAAVETDLAEGLLQGLTRADLLLGGLVKCGDVSEDGGIKRKEWTKL
jgi:hypothetical protein